MRARGQRKAQFVTAVSGCNQPQCNLVQHPDFGETVLGVMVAKDGAQLDTDAIASAAGQSLARFKHPRKLVILDELPRNPMSKVQKNLLLDQFSGTFVQ